MASTPNSGYPAVRRFAKDLDKKAIDPLVSQSEGEVCGFANDRRVCRVLFHEFFRTFAEVFFSNDVRYA
jgi:hypothetical protein